MNKFHNTGNCNQYVLRVSKKSSRFTRGKYLSIPNVGSGQYKFIEDINAATVYSTDMWKRVAEGVSLKAAMKECDWVPVERETTIVKNQHYTCELVIEGINTSNPEKAAQLFIESLVKFPFRQHEVKVTTSIKKAGFGGISIDMVKVSAKTIGDNPIKEYDDLDYYDDANDYS